MGSVGHSHCEATKLEMNHTKLARPESGKAAITLSKTKTGPGGAISNSVQYKSRQPCLYISPSPETSIGGRALLILTNTLPSPTP